MSLSPRTIDKYIQYISVKIGINSQEEIRDFAKTAPEINLLTEHYMNLHAQQIFCQIASKLKNKELASVFIEDLIILYLKKLLIF